jgi:hypothetical protein
VELLTLTPHMYLHESSRNQGVSRQFRSSQSLFRRRFWRSAGNLPSCLRSLNILIAGVGEMRRSQAPQRIYLVQGWWNRGRNRDPGKFPPEVGLNNVERWRRWQTLWRHTKENESGRYDPNTSVPTNTRLVFEGELSPRKEVGVVCRARAI